VEQLSLSQQPPLHNIIDIHRHIDSGTSVALEVPQQQ
jgi:hypothetical protein